MRDILSRLLRYALVNEHDKVAGELMEAFGGKIENIMDAPFDDLMRFKGMTDSAAVLLKLIPDCHRLCGIDRWSDTRVFKGTADMGCFLADRICSPATENFFAAFLDSKGKMLKFQRLSEGGVARTEISIRKVVELAINCRADRVIMAHNHPSGNLCCSAQDIEVTIQLKNALAGIDIALDDHFIVNGNEYWSMKENGVFPE